MPNSVQNQRQQKRQIRNHPRGANLRELAERAEHGGFFLCGDEGFGFRNPLLRRRLPGLFRFRNKAVSRGVLSGVGTPQGVPCTLATPVRFQAQLACFPEPVADAALLARVVGAVGGVIVGAGGGVAAQSTRVGFVSANLLLVFTVSHGGNRTAGVGRRSRGRPFHAQFRHERAQHGSDVGRDQARTRPDQRRQQTRGFFSQMTLRRVLQLRN